MFEASLVPFITKVYLDGRRLMQDNPKHCSRLARPFFELAGINWWRTPPESPDLNPIENVWCSLKRYLRDYHKPRNQATLIEGIKMFRKTLSPTVCCLMFNTRIYIMHTFVSPVNVFAKNAYVFNASLPLKLHLI